MKEEKMIKEGKNEEWINKDYMKKYIEEKKRHDNKDMERRYKSVTSTEINRWIHGEVMETTQIFN